MLTFKKYSSIENHFNREFMEHVVEQMPQDLKNLRQGFVNRFEEVVMQRHIVIDKHSIYLNHYPFLCFSGSYKDDVWQLFGHVHTRRNNTGIDANRLQYLYPTQYDVGVDNNNFTPVSYDQVRKIIEKQLNKK